MGSAQLLSIVGACAIRILLGADAGMDYDTTALSISEGSEEPVARNPWALRIRPDILFAAFNSRQFFYTTATGTFVQPYQDTFEAGGELLIGARLRHGRTRLTFHPGAFTRVTSANELLRSSDGISLSSRSGMDRLFWSVSTGGWLELEWPVMQKLRFLARYEIETWIRSIIPDDLRGLQPTLTMIGTLQALVAVTRRDGFAVEGQIDEGMFLPEPLDPDDEQAEAEPTEHQLGITTRLIYRRFWLPYLMTDVSIGAIVLRDRSEESSSHIGSEPTRWQPNIAAGFTFMLAGRPRWLNININYE